MTDMSPRLVAPLLLLLAACGSAPPASSPTATTPSPPSTTTPSAASPETTIASSSAPPVSDTCPPATLTLEQGPDGGFPLTPVLPDGDAAVTGAVTDMFCSPEWTLIGPEAAQRTVAAPAVLPAGDATCIADRLVRTLGAGRVRDLGLGAGPWGLLSFGLTNNSGEHHIDRGEAETIVAVFIDCSTQWELLLILTVTEGADKISDTSAACVSDRLGSNDAEEILISEIDRAYDDIAQPDAAPFAYIVAPLIAAYDACLSPLERDALDFD